MPAETWEAPEAPAPERGVLRVTLIAALLCWAWVAIPLIAGRDTLFVRDVMSIHFPLKAGQR